MAFRLTSVLTRGLDKYTVKRSIPSFIAQLQSSCRYMSGMSDQFNEAKENVGKLTQDPGNEVKLKMYALFKQVKLETNPPRNFFVAEGWYDYFETDK